MSGIVVWNSPSARVLTLVVTLAVLVGPSSAGWTQAEAASECVVEEVVGIGPACLRDDGLYEVFDADGRSLGLTHGPDAPPAEDEAMPFAGREPACVKDEDEGYFARVIYAYASDRSPSQSDTTIRDLVRTANAIVYDAAASLGGERDLRVLCTQSDTIDVARVQVETPLSQITFSSLVSDLTALGFDDHRVHYWVYFEDRISCGCSGIGHVASDDRASTANANNGNGWRYAVTFGYLSTRTMLHEISHNNGAVQNWSPNTSGGFHCNDGKDIMCYSDGGSKSNYRNDVCSSEVFDCNKDDYFHIDPPAGTYLDRSWNLGHIHNRFMRGCQEATGTLDVGLGPLILDAPLITTSASVDIPASCAGREFILEGWLPVVELSVASVGLAADLDICWYAAGEQVDCATAYGRPSGVVPPGADEARIILKAGAEATYFLRIG